MEQLPDTVGTALKGDESKVRIQAQLEDKLLYNRGAAADAGVRVIFEQLHARTS